MRYMLSTAALLLLRSSACLAAFVTLAEPAIQSGYQGNDKQGGSAILTGDVSTNTALVLSAYYPEVLQQTLPPGTTTPFNIFPSDVGLIGGQPYTAGMEPGTYPYQEPVMTSPAWAPGVASWLGTAVQVGNAWLPQSLELTIAPPPQWAVIQAAYISYPDNIPLGPAQSIAGLGVATPPSQAAGPAGLGMGSRPAPGPPPFQEQYQPPQLVTPPPGAPRFPVQFASVIPNTKLWIGSALQQLKIAYAYRNGTAMSTTAINGCISRANIEVAKTNFYSVTQQTLFMPPSNDKRDYISLGPYMWPCDSYPKKCTPRWGGTTRTCNTATHLPWISCDLTGQKNPSVPAAKLGDVQFGNYWAAVTDLALAYDYTENTTYATRAAYLTRQFFLNTTTRMNPNINYGQMWPGVRQGSPSGITDIMKIVEILDSIKLIALNPKIWTATDQQSFNTWCQQLLSWYWTNTLGVQAREAANNIAWWYHHNTMSLALHTGNTAAAQWLVNNLNNVVIPQQVSANGNLTQEVIRATSRNYVGYTLTAITRLATMSRGTTLSLWGNSRLRNCFAMFAQYANGARPWPYKDTQNPYDFKFWAEWLHSAALGLSNTNYERAYINRKGGAVRGFGEPPAAVYKWLLMALG